MVPIRSDLPKDKMENALLYIMKLYGIVSTRHGFFRTDHLIFIFTLNGLT